MALLMVGLFIGLTKRNTENTKGYHIYQNIMKTRLLKNIEHFTAKKNEAFQMKKSARIHISAQNIDCGYLLEPPRQGGFNKYQQSMFLAEIRKLMYNPVNPLYYIKVGFKGVKIILACFHDGG